MRDTSAGVQRSSSRVHEGGGRAGVFLRGDERAVRHERAVPAQRHRAGASAVVGGDGLGEARVVRDELHRRDRGEGEEGGGQGTSGQGQGGGYDRCDLRPAGDPAQDRDVGEVQQAGCDYGVDVRGDGTQVVGEHPTHARADGDERPVSDPNGQSEEELLPVSVGHVRVVGGVGEAVAGQISQHHLDAEGRDVSGERAHGRGVAARAVYEKGSDGRIIAADRLDMDIPPPVPPGAHPHLRPRGDGADE